MSAPSADQSQPVYQRIKADLREQVLAGQLQPGDVVPPRRQLMQMYGCSWATVQRALNELALEGWIRAERGRGTFVCNPPSPPPGYPASANLVPALPREPWEPQGKTSHPEAIPILLMHPVHSVYYSLAQMMEGIRDAAHQRGRPVSYLDAPPDLRPRLNLHGQIIITPALEDRSLLEAAWERGERFVVLGSDYDEAIFPCVNADTRGWTRRAVRHLVQAGHRCIGLLGNLPGFPNYLRERQGFCDALDEAGIPWQPDWILPRTRGAEGLEDDIIRWLADHPQATAVFAADYTTALALVKVTKGLGLRIPEDLSVMAMDELPSAGMLRVPLSVVIQPFRQLGRRAVDRLCTLLESGEAGGTELLPCQILLRDSVAPVNTSALPAPGSARKPQVVSGPVGQNV